MGSALAGNGWTVQIPSTDGYEMSPQGQVPAPASCALSPFLPTPLGDRDQSVGAPPGRTDNSAPQMCPRIPRNQGVVEKKGQQKRGRDGLWIPIPSHPNPPNQKLGTGDV